MKLHVLNDIHLEFQKWRRAWDVASIDCDVHVLAGDIGPGLQGIQFALDHFTKPVIYVAGNHEFYGNGRTVAQFWEDAREKTHGTHVHLLQNEIWIQDNVRFLGCTLWTDFALLGAAEAGTSMGYAANNMTDYQVIQTGWLGSGYGKNKRALLTPRRVLAWHHESRDFLEQNIPLQPDEPMPLWEKTVVVTHHAPSEKSLAGGRAFERIDTAYASNLDRLVARTDLWIHGHTHEPVDYMIEPGRVISNPRGYDDRYLDGEYAWNKVIEL